MCTCPPVSRGSVSITRYQSLNLTPDDIPSIPWARSTTPPDPPGGFGEKGFQLVPVSWLGLRGSCVEAVPQPRNLSRKVFIAASRREGCSDYLGKIMQGILGDRRSPSSALCKGAVAERESSTYLVWRNEKAPLHARKCAYTNSLWAYVWRMDRHRSESNERQSGVCTKSAKRRFRTQDLRFVER